MEQISNMTLSLYKNLLKTSVSKIVTVALAAPLIIGSAHQAWGAYTPPKDNAAGDIGKDAGVGNGQLGNVQPVQNAAADGVGNSTAKDEVYNLDFHDGGSKVTLDGSAATKGFLKASHSKISFDIKDSAGADGIVAVNTANGAYNFISVNDPAASIKEVKITGALKIDASAAATNAFTLINILNQNVNDGACTLSVRNTEEIKLTGNAGSRLINIADGKLALNTTINIGEDENSVVTGEDDANTILVNIGSSAAAGDTNLTITHKGVMTTATPQGTAYKIGDKGGAGAFNCGITFAKTALVKVVDLVSLDPASQTKCTITIDPIDGVDYAKISGAIVLGANPESSITVGAGTKSAANALGFDCAVTFGDDGQTLSLPVSPLKAIKGPGTVIATEDVTFAQPLGELALKTSLLVNGGKKATFAAANFYSDVTLASATSELIINANKFGKGSVKAANNGAGILNLTGAGAALTIPGNVGENDKRLAAVNLPDQYTVTFNGNVYANTITLRNDVGTASTLTTGNDNIKIVGDIDKTTASTGKILVNNIGVQFTGNIGRNGPIKEFKVADNKSATLNYGGSLQADNTIIGNNSFLTIKFAGNGLKSNIDHGGAGASTLIFNSPDNTVTLQTTIGAGVAVTNLQITGGTTLDANGKVIKATNILLKDGGAQDAVIDLKLDPWGHDITKIEGETDNFNIVKFSADSAIGTDIGAAGGGFYLKKLVVNNCAVETDANKSVYVGTVELNGAKAEFTHKHNKLLQPNCTITTTAPHTGTYQFGTTLINAPGQVGTEGAPLAAVNTVDAGTNKVAKVYADTVKIGAGDPASQLQVADGGAIYGYIQGGGGDEGKLNLLGHYTTNGPIGSVAKLAVVGIAGAKTLTINDNISSTSIHAYGGVGDASTIIINRAGLNLNTTFEAKDAIGGGVDRPSRDTIVVAASHAFKNSFGSQFKTLSITGDGTVASFAAAAVNIKADNVKLALGTTLDVSGAKHTIVGVGGTTLNGGTLNVGSSNLTIEHPNIILNGAINLDVDWNTGTAGKISTTKGGVVDIKQAKFVLPAVPANFTINNKQITIIDGTDAITNLGQETYIVGDDPRALVVGKLLSPTTLSITYAGRKATLLTSQSAAAGVTDPAFLSVVKVVDDMASAEADTPERKAADALTALSLSDPDAFKQVVQVLRQDGTSTAANMNVFNATTNQLLTATNIAMVEGLNQVSTPMPQQGLATGDGPQSCAVWAQALGSSVNQDNVGEAGQTFKGYKSDGGGGAVGLNAYNFFGELAGFSFSYLKTKVKQNDGNLESNDVDSYIGAVYGAVKPADNIILSLIAGGGHHKINRTGYDTNLKKTKNSYCGGNYFTQIIGWYGVEYNGASFEPGVYLDGGYMYSNTYTVRGSEGTVPQRVARRSSTYCRPGLQFTARYGAMGPNGWDSEINAMVRITHNLAAKQGLALVQLEGSANTYSMAFQGPKPARNMFEGQLGIKLRKDQFEVNLSYLVSLRRHFNAHTGLIRFVYHC